MVKYVRFMGWRGWEGAAAAACAWTCALSALPVAAQTSNVEVFGDLSIGVTHQTGTNAPAYKEQSSLSWANALGFRGREDLGGGTSAIFALVASVDVDTGALGNATATWKNSYVGLSNRTWGTLMLGRNDELMSSLCSLDAMCWRGVIHTLRPGNLDRVGGAQLSNMLRYNSPDLGPFRFKTYVTLGEDSTKPNGRASGVQADFRAEGLQVGAAYETLNNITVTPGSPAVGFGLTNFFGTAAEPSTAFALDKARITGLGARYTVGAFTVTGLATRVNFRYQGQDKAWKSLNLGTIYKVTDLLEASAGCSRMTFDSSQWTTCQLGAFYWLSKRTSLFALAAHQSTSGAFARPQLFLQGGFGSVGGSTDLQAVGIRHIF